MSKENVQKVRWRKRLLFEGTCVAVAISLFILTGCTLQPKDSFSSLRVGVSFDFPEGWSPLSQDEMKKMFPGKGEGVLVTISDPERIAIVALVEASFDREEIQAINCFSNLLIHSMESGKKSDSLTEAENKVIAFYAIVFASIKKALPPRYEGFRMLREGSTVLGGIPVGEFVFEGLKPGEDKEKKWRRLIVMLPKNANNKVLLLAFTTPLSKKGKYSASFKHVEKTWKW